jgi:hypothetical protein
MDGIVWALFGLVAAALAVLASALFLARSRIERLRVDLLDEIGKWRSSPTGRIDGPRRLL